MGYGSGVSPEELARSIKLKVRRDRAADGYVAGVPELGVWSGGKTVEEAVDAAREALLLYLRNHPAFRGKAGAGR